MARLGRLGFLAVAVLFHLIYIYSIFDIYFVSPIVHGMRRYQVDADPPAKRLFLIVGDGLRADKCFQSHPPPFAKAGENLTPRPLAPFLRSRVLEHGTFGVSHTRVPTESRPGHVALIAGLYEDVSAVTTGWKINPVDFDSVFNRSRHTWSWGSPDILPMFAIGATPGRVDAYTYGAEEEDWTADATELDTWVFDHVKDFFTSAQKDKELHQALNEDKIVFFLHLLGLDSTGHAHRPYSEEYLRSLQIVDAGVKQLVADIDKFYNNDGKTAWVFTADHGMSDWGSHGDGHPDNTRTPLIAWGAGVNKPKPRTKPILNDDPNDIFSTDWNLDSVQRNDVNQADVAALMAYLVGLEYPANSVGELPLAYISADDRVKAKAAFANMQQILEMYFVKEMQKRETDYNFQPFEALFRGERSFENLCSEVSQLIERGLYQEAIEKSLSFINLGLKGLRYLQTYDWLFLRTLVSIGYLGWIVFALVTVIDLHVLQGRIFVKRTALSSGAFLAVFIGLYASFALQRRPWTYYAYAFFPVLFWEEIWASRLGIQAGIPLLMQQAQNKRVNPVLWIAEIVIYVLLLELMVIGYFHREVFTYCFLGLVFWPMLYGGKFLKRNAAAIACWSLCCTIMSSFTLLPVGKKENLTQIMAGGILICLAGAVYLGLENRWSSSSQHATTSNYTSRSIMGLQVGLVALSMFVTSSSIISLQAKKGLPLGNQIVGWIVLVSSLAAPALHKLQPQTHYLHRLMVVFLAFAPIYIILSISYEVLFYVAFSAILLLWIQIESKVADETNFGNSNAAPRNGKGHRLLSISDTRVALFFFFFIQVAFFGTGNVASLSAFSLESVQRLVPVFDPFAMSALLILKLLIPFAIISANLGILNHKLRVAPSAIFMVVIAVSDVLTLNFFYLVRDEGSWLEIGTTISHFCIASLLCVFVAFLEPVSEYIIDGVHVDGEVVRGDYHHFNDANGVQGVSNGQAPNKSLKTSDAIGQISSPGKASLRKKGSRRKR